MRKIYWIDDFNDSQTLVPTGAVRAHLEQLLDAQIVVPQIKIHSDFDKLLLKSDFSKSYGVFMDYQLTKVGEGASGEFGSTWAAQLRAILPQIPVIGISKKREQDIPRFQLKNFLAFFDRGALQGDSPPVEDIKSIFDGYKKVWTAWSKNKRILGMDLITKLVSPPNAIKDLFISAIPDELRRPWDIESPHLTARWIWHQFQGVAGFLFDDLETATYLGITKDAFLKYQDRFDGARYTGVMASSSSPRWWVGKLRDVAAIIMETRAIGPISHSRRELLKALGEKPRNIENCFAKPHGRNNSESPPECVAFRDQNSKDEFKKDKRVQALLIDTAIDPVDSNPALGFQSLRHFQQYIDDSH